ncbi:MAG: YIP1 family protein [Candidatus Binataceae bacterium]
MASATLPSAETPERGNSLGRIFGVLFDPKGTFQSIVRRPTWLAPILVLTVISLGMNSMLAIRVDWRAYLENQLERTGRLDRIPKEQRQQTLTAAAIAQKYTMYFRGATGDIVLALFASAIYLGLFNLLVGAELKFKTVLSIVSYTMMPTALKEILGIVILFFKVPGTVNPINFIASSVGAFLSNDSPTWLLTLGVTIDVFAYWTMILAVIGLHAANPKKIKIGTAAAVVIGLYLFFVALAVGLTAVFT